MNSNNKTISILISAYNDAEYLEQCFESLLNQSYTDFEVIFRDNNSEDDSYSIALSYRKIFQKKGIYLFTDLNKRTVHRYKCDRMCIGASEGGFLYNLSPKYVLKNDALENIMDVFIQNESLGALIVGNSSKKYFLQMNAENTIDRKNISNWILQGGSVQHSNLIVKRIATIPIGWLQSAYTFWENTEKAFLLSCFFDIGLLQSEIFFKSSDEIDLGMESLFERYIFEHQMLKISKELNIDENDSLERSFTLGMECLARYSLEQAKNADTEGKQRLALQYTNLARVFDTTIRI